MINCLTIAGSDSGGGAGIQADLKVFHTLGCFGTSVITCLTAQNTLGIKSLFPISSQFIEEQIDAVLEDISIQSIKIGMLLNADIISAVAKKLKYYKAKYNFKVILDTVMVSKSGVCLLDPNALGIFIHELIPLADVLTPNIPEAMALLGYKGYEDMNLFEVAKKLFYLGSKCVVLKGGHSKDLHMSNDILYYNIDGVEYSKSFEAKRIETKNSHGTGCTFAAALCAFLARNDSLEDAVFQSKKFVTAALYCSKNIIIGHGQGPANLMTNYLEKVE